MAFKPTARSYNFAIITYPSDYIDFINLLRDDRIAHYAFIYHDKDVKEDGSKKEPHYHVLIHARSQTTCERVQNWFSLLNCNTFVEPLASRKGSYDYLTHANAPEKFQYDPENVVSDMHEFWQEDPENENKAYQILTDIIGGTSCRELARRYGREIIINYQSYVTFARAIMREEGDYNFNNEQ